MDIATKERLIAKINWGYVPITVNTQDGHFISLLLHPPTPKELAQAAGVYSVELQRAIIINLPHETEVLENMIALGQWSLQKEVEIEGLQKDIHTICRGLLDFVFNTTKLKAARSLLRRAEAALIERLNQKHILLQSSAEANATIYQQRFLISQMTETNDGKRFWSTAEEFDDYSDNKLITQLCEAFFYKSRIPVGLIRELARSSQWRAYWEISKNTNDLFDNPVSAWSLNQRELAYWSTIYDSVNNALERPSKDITDDDDLLDSWFIRQGEKLDSQTSKGMISKSDKPGRNEEFIMADKEGAKHIYNMNDPNARRQIRARQKVLAQKGSVKEQDMPDSQREMQQQLIAKQRKHVKNIGHK